MSSNEGDTALPRVATYREAPVAWMVFTEDGESNFITDSPLTLEPHQRILPLFTQPIQKAEGEPSLSQIVNQSQREPATKHEIDTARAVYCSTGDGYSIEVDDDATTSIADEGRWISAWVWLDNSELGYPDPDEEEEE